MIAIKIHFIIEIKRFLKILDEFPRTNVSFKNENYLSDHDNPDYSNKLKSAIKVENIKVVVMASKHPQGPFTLANV